MNILIGFSIIAFIVYSLWNSKTKKATSNNLSQPIKISTALDKPVDFGSKNVWIAVKTHNKSELSKILELRDVNLSNWKSGIDSAYDNGVFITPQIGEWTLAVGFGLPLGDCQKSIEKLEKTLNKLSSEFGEAHFYGTFRIVEYHNWMKSVNGKMERIYSYVGERSENVKVYGKPTEPESRLNLFNSLAKEAAIDGYDNREVWDYPDEELVFKIAENWSINPDKLTQRTDVKNELGMVGL